MSGTAPAPSVGTSPPPIPATPPAVAATPLPSPNPPAAQSPPPAVVTAPPPIPSNPPPSTPAPTSPTLQPPPSPKNPSPPSNNGTIPSPPKTTPAPPTNNPSPPTPVARSPPSSIPSPPSSSRGNTPPKEVTRTGNGGSGISSAAIVGIAVAGALAAIVLCLVVVCLRRKPKRRRHQDDLDYGSGPSPYKPDGLYETGRRPRPDPYKPPPPVSHTKPYAYGSPGQLQPPQKQPPPPPPPPPPGSDYMSSGSQNSWQPVPPPPPPPHHSSSPSLGTSRSWFTYDELESATGGFARSNLLGEGGFGCVYKGYLSGGQIVAVKQLKAGSGQGEREFKAEVEIISRVHHRHLVSLVGYCIADSQRLLVYDYVPNGTLEYHLHAKGRPVMEWQMRLRIAAGAARGLAYLHEDCHPRIIHRDIKSSNILLDNNYEAQVSDFGLAKLASDTYTHVTTRVMGTFGYLAPEYASTGKLTDKSDVYSFGVVLLELLTGRKPVDTTQPVGEESLVEWARPLLTQALESGTVEPLVDRRLINYNESEMLRMLEAAAACVRHSASKRPRMAQVVRALENDGPISELNQGVRPGYSSNYGSADYDTNQYNVDMRKFRQMALGSAQYGSEFSAPTSEYGMNPSISSGSEAAISEEKHNEKRNEPLSGR